jgi:mRNA interferase HigB
VNVISRRGLNEMLEGKSLEVITEVKTWFLLARRAKWEKLSDVRMQYPSADQVGNIVIFNIRRNRYRLITYAVFAKQKLYVKALLTHAEYDRGELKKWV